MSLSDIDVRRVFFSQRVTIARDKQSGEYRALFIEEGGSKIAVPLNVCVGTKEEVLTAIGYWMNNL
jgi:hypothetical protein